jgi:transposase-like protein
MKQSEMNLCPRCGSDQTTLVKAPIVTSAWFLGGPKIENSRCVMRCANCKTEYQRDISIPNGAPSAVQFRYSYLGLDDGVIPVDVEHSIED